MWPLIRCYAGCELGSLYLLYKAILNKKLKALYGDDVILPSMRLDAAKELTMGKELTDIGLGIDRICCRTHMLTQVEFKNL